MSEIKINGEWQAVVVSTTRKLKLCAAIKQNYTLGPDGCAALAKVIDDMAGKLDIATAYINELEKERS